MTIQGYFKDIYDEEKYVVTISSGIGASYPIIDPTDDEHDITTNSVFFSPDPVHITCDRSDLTQLIMISQAQIKLKVGRDMSSDLFAGNNRDISVTISRASNNPTTDGILFYGYIDPLQFDEGFAHPWEEVTINCTDPLGALEQLTVDDLTDVEETDVIQVINFIYKILECVFENEPEKFSGMKTFFSNQIDPNSIKVNASVFFGKDKDDRMTLYDTLYELLKYLGCTLCYEPKSGNVILYNIYSSSGGYEEPNMWFNAKEDAMDASATLSVDDVYSKVTCTCEIEPSDDDIELIDDEQLFSDYQTYQKYMTEIISEGEGRSAYDGFAELLKSPDGSECTDGYDAGYRIDHYCYVKRSKLWSFGNNSYIEAMNGSEDKTKTALEQKMKGDQSGTLRWLKNNDIKAAFVSFGKGNKLNAQDNSPVNNISLTDYLAISINGHNDHNVNGHNLQMFNAIQSNSPICKYNGLNSINLTPIDETVTNYIVISGKMILNPIQPKTGLNWSRDTGYVSEGDDNYMYEMYNASTNTFNMTKQYVSQKKDGDYYFWHRTVPHSTNEYGAYYQQKFWTCADAASPSYSQTDQMGIVGFVDNKKQEILSYNYSSYGNSSDAISKLPILACQLKVGDKWCVERLDLGHQGEGKFEWMTQEEWDESPLKTKGYVKPYFTIGIDPAVGDKIVGRSYSIQNNIEHTMNVDASGTAIPIVMTDRLNGPVEFNILGPINSMWNVIERIHPSFWRHTNYVDHKFWLLELLDDILISDFKISFKTDNALINAAMTTADNDLVYATDTNPAYTEKLETDLKICTPLTIQECADWGVKYQISNSYVFTADDLPFRGWGPEPAEGEEDDRIKPEELWVDYLYSQYCNTYGGNVPRKVTMNVNNGDTYGSSTLDGTYLNVAAVPTRFIVTMQSNQIGGSSNYYCMSIDWSLKEKQNNMTLRQRLPYSNPLSN